MPATLVRTPEIRPPRQQSVRTRQVSTFATTGGAALELAAAGHMVPWAGTIVVEGAKSGDRRGIVEGALSWPDLPLPLMAQFVNPVGGDGHDGALLAGRIDTIERRGGEVFATGWIDPAAPGGMDLINALEHGLMRGISVDLDDVDMIDSRARDGLRLISRGRIRGATATPFQAFVEATIELTAPDMAIAASGARRRRSSCARVWMPHDAFESRLVAMTIDNENGLVASAARIPVDPPKEWFAKRSVDRVTPLTVTPDGQVFGHIAAWGTCHISFGRCVPVPRSQSNYAAFRNGSVLTAEGEEIRTGPIVMDTVHPDLRLKASDTMAFYAHSGSAIADVVPYEDAFGIMVVGALRPDAKPEHIRAFRGSDISPDWRTVNGTPREMVALLAVNNGGFKVPQSLAASAGVYVMPGETAAAFDGDECVALVASGPVRPDELVETTPDEPADADLVASGGRTLRDAEKLLTDTDQSTPPGSGGCSGEASSCGCGCSTEMSRDERQAAIMERFGSKPRQFMAPRRRAVRVFHSRRHL